MKPETWGLLATPPRDLVTIQRRLRARRVARFRARQRDEENYTIFRALAEAAKSEGWYSKT